MKWRWVNFIRGSLMEGRFLKKASRGFFDWSKVASWWYRKDR
jgi:hypothetical protein